MPGKKTSAGKRAIKNKETNRPKRNFKPKDRQMKQIVQFRLDPEKIKKLEQAAKNKGHTLSSFIRFLVETFLKERGKK